MTQVRFSRKQKYCTFKQSLHVTYEYIVLLYLNKYSHTHTHIYTTIYILKFHKYRFTLNIETLQRGTVLLFIDVNF